MAYLTEAEVAELLRKSVRTLQGWRVAGIGPPFHKFGRSVRYLEAEVLDWAARHRYRSTSEFDARRVNDAASVRRGR